MKGQCFPYGETCSAQGLFDLEVLYAKAYQAKQKAKECSIFGVKNSRIEMYTLYFLTAMTLGYDVITRSKPCKMRQTTAVVITLVFTLFCIWLRVHDKF